MRGGYELQRSLWLTADGSANTCTWLADCKAGTDGDGSSQTLVALHSTAPVRPLSFSKKAALHRQRVPV